MFTAVKEDSRIWWPDRKGAFSVGSAYNMCLNDVLDTSHLVVEGDWQKLWKLEVPLKVKNFLWRVCRDSIPTRDLLRSRGIQLDVTCPMCGVAEETVKHSLLECSRSVWCWRKANLWDVIDRHGHSGSYFREVFFTVLQLLSHKEQQVLTMTLWSLWSSRNLKVWEDKLEGYATIVGRGQSVLEDWVLVRKNPKRQIDRDVRTVEPNKWRKPPCGSVKCNVDASFCSRNNKVGVGMCIRDEFVYFLGAKTCWFSPLVEVRMGEAMGLKAAIEWVQELGFDDVVFELDAKLVVDGLKSASVDATELGSVLAECRELLVSSFTNSHVEFTRRYANMVAHNLAKAAIYNANPQLFIDIPTCIEQLISNEMH